MSELTVEERLAAALEENAVLKRELEARAVVAARALATFQQRALLMEVTRQQNEDLDRLASELARARTLEEQRAQEMEASARLKSEFWPMFRTKSAPLSTAFSAIATSCFAKKASGSLRTVDVT